METKCILSSGRNKTLDNCTCHATFNSQGHDLLHTYTPYSPNKAGGIKPVLSTFFSFFFCLSIPQWSIGPQPTHTKS
ncbi:unnamed protein product, partial [Candidula unifasciata]